MREIYYQMRFALPVWLVFLLCSVLPDNRISIRIRGRMIACILLGKPKRLLIGRDVTLLSIDRLYVGADVYFAKGVWLNAIGGLHIEDEVVLAPYVVMSSTNHGFLNGSVFGGGAHPASIVIGKGSWIAAHAVVVAGVTLGSGNLVAANSVVTRDTCCDVVVAGVPAEVVRKRVDNPSLVLSKSDV